MVAIKNIFLFSAALLGSVTCQPAGTTGGSRPPPKPLDRIVHECTRFPETSDFRNYHLENRLRYTPISENNGAPLFKSSPNLGGLVTTTVESYLQDSTIVSGVKEIQYKISIANSDTVPRSAQFAWSANKDSRVPESTFTVTAKVGQVVEGCVILPTTSATKYVTYSTF